MQLTISCNDRDRWIIKEIEERAYLQKKSKSSVIIAMLEGHFTKGKKIGEILVSWGLLSEEELKKGLEIQKQQKHKPLLGEILLSEGFVKEIELKRALTMQRGSLED